MDQRSFNLSDPGPQVYDLSKWGGPVANEFVTANGGNGSWSKGPHHMGHVVKRGFQEDGKEKN